MTKPETTTIPDGATGEYQDYNQASNTTWVKDLDLKQPDYPLAYVWSWTTKRWRSKREKIRMDRVRMFP